MPPTTLTKEQAIERLAQAGNVKAQEIVAGTRPAPDITPPPVVPLTNQDGSINAQGLRPATIQMPEPTAIKEAEKFQAGLQIQIANAQQDLETVRRQNLQEAIKRAEDLAKKQEALLLNPADDPLQQETRKLAAEQMETAQQAVIAQREDFNARRATVSELQKLLTEGNKIIEEQRSRFASRVMQQKNIQNAIVDIQGRAGVLEATIAALDGNIQLSRQLISDAQRAVASVYQDEVNYNNALLKIVSNKELTIDAEHRLFAKSRLEEAEKKLNTIQKTSEYIQSLMIDPRSAKFIKDAGVSLTDSIEEINTKIAKQQEIEEINDTIRELTIRGYEYVPFGTNRPDVITIPVGGKELSFIPPVEDVRAVGSVGTLTPIDENAVIKGVPVNADGTIDVTSQQYIENVIKQSSKFTKTPTQSERENLTKFQSVIAQTGNLISSLKNTDTDPIIGFLKNLNPYDFDARTVNAQLQALVPGVARGVYGEVGVLTDADIRNYMQTLPNLRSTKEQNKFVGLLTLKNAQRSFENTLKSLANSGVNVSGWLPDYIALTKDIEKIEEELGVEKKTDQELEKEFQDFTNEERKEKKGFWKTIGEFFFGK